MQVLDLTFIDKANGSNLVTGLENLSIAFKFNLSDLRKKVGLSESTFSRWLSDKRYPSSNSRLKI
ncbi:MAG: hypothetical protein AB8G05_16625 [Oligoflexales bacterium]